MKICSKCGVEKSVEEFSKNKQQKNGLSCWCKECVKECGKKYIKTPAGKSAKQKAMVKYNNTQAGKSAKQKSQKKILHSQERIARNKLNYAIKSGKVIKPSVCSGCNNTENIQAHHWDYEQPLKVWWLCKECHGFLHNEIRRNNDKSITTDRNTVSK